MSGRDVRSLPTRVVVVLGASRSGLKVAKKLSKEKATQVIVIDMLDRKFNVEEGAFSLLVEETLAFEAIEHPIELVHNLVTAVDLENQTVHLTGRTIKYSVLVVATGLAQPAVFSFGNRLTTKSSREDLLVSVDSFKESVFSSVELERRLKRQRKQIASSAAGAVVVGSSKLAVELAATLKEQHGTAYRVSLASPESRLVPEMTEADSERLLASLKSRGILVRLNCSTGFADAAAAGAVVLDCTATRSPNTDFLQACAAGVLDGEKFVLTDGMLRLAGGSGVEFAVGPVVSGGARAGDAGVVAKNVAALLHGKTPSATRSSKAAKTNKVASVALGVDDFFSVGLLGKLEAKRRVATRNEAAVGFAN